ncbi:MAG TPA: tetratricopeptide repeat protein [Kofleriaceae bacterium]
MEPLPAAMASAFAEPSRVGPGTISSTAGGADPNTAWPPRPIPSGLSSPDAALRHGAIRDPAAEGSDQLQVLTRRRLWWIGGAVGSIAVGVVIAAALINPSDTPSDQSPDSASERSAPGPGRGPRGPRRVREVAAAPARPAAAATPARKPPAPRSPPAAEMPAARSTPPGRSLAVAAAPPSAPARPGPHAAKKLITKKLVVDYSSRPSDPAPPGLVAQTEEDPAIGKARGAYTTGNQKLFAGDLDGAIHSYHQALELYPGYVGGYRGLGLAYAQLGDTASALEALTTYIEAVPAARDAALIRKRIARLQAR